MASERDCEIDRDALLAPLSRPSGKAAQAAAVRVVEHDGESVAGRQEDVAIFPFKVVKAPDGGILVNLMYEKDGSEGEFKAFTPEQLLAMLFVNLKSTAEVCVCVSLCVCVFNE